MSRPLIPAADPWTLAVHDSETGFAPVGTAVAISARTALTCAHVVLTGFDKPAIARLVEPLWVSFPKVTSAWRVRRLVTRVEYDVDDPQIADVALLHLAEDMPPAVEPARLKLLEPEVLAGQGGRSGQRWWTFGFPRSSRNGNEASGTVGARLAHGWVRLDTESKFPVETGFSGGGLWVPEYAAVAGIVGQAVPAGRHRAGDAQALTLAQAAMFLPSGNLQVLAGWAAADAGSAAMAAWGWELETDPEAGRHWRPRGRGVTSDLEAGHRFHGRRAALTRVVGWLDRRRPDRRVLVVTGSPGVGKSAVLGRVVTTADRRLRSELPADDDGVMATVGSIGCAVHVKGKTALDVATEIAQAAGAELPQRIDNLVAAVNAVLMDRPARFNIVIDAVDEAASVEDARAVLTEVVLPLVQTCGHLGVQVVCGSRRYDAGGHLLDSLTGAADEIDLDEPRFFELADLEAYTEATLRLVGAERSGNPYADPLIAGPVAARIAELAEPNFLVAGLDARRRGLYDAIAADAATLTLTATVDAALDAYLDRVAPVDGIDARAVLTALAYAEAPGWSGEVWAMAAAALGSTADDVRLDRFAHSAAASFLIETSTATDASVFRLFHQALNDALLRDRGQGRANDERHLTEAMCALGRRHGWAAAPAYLLRSLSGHADRAGLIDDLLTDDDYLMHADLLRLVPVANQARTDAGRERARLLNLTPQAITAPPAERSAMFSVTRSLEGLAPLGTRKSSPYWARWASARHRVELRQLDVHTGWVRAVCPVTVSGRTLLVSAGDDGVVRLWDPGSGVQQQQLEGHTGGVLAVCPVVVSDKTLLATASDDGTVRVWDLSAGAQLRLFNGHAGGATAVCSVDIGHRSLLATGDAEGTVRLWDLDTGIQHRRLDGHDGGVTALCPVTLEDRKILATAGVDRTVRLWDLDAGVQRRHIVAHTSEVYAMCVIRVDGQLLLATTGNDRTVQLWDPRTGFRQRQIDGHARGVTAVCPVAVGRRTLIATASIDRTVRIWDPGSGRQQQQLDGHTGKVYAVCSIVVDGRTLLATAGDDGTVRLWDPDISGQEHQVDGHAGGVYAVCSISSGDRTLLATAGNDQTVRLWDTDTGRQQRQLDARVRAITAMCQLRSGERTFLATAGTDSTVRLWDLGAGAQQHQIDGQEGGITAMCSVVVNGRTLLAVAGNDRTVRLCDPATGDQQHQVDGHGGGVTAVSSVPVAGRTLLATAGDDGIVRLWDPGTGTQQLQLNGHAGWVYAVSPVPMGGQTLLATAGDDGIVRLWDASTGVQLRQFNGHTRWVYAVCPVVVGGSTLLATAGYDRTVRLWDVSSGRCEWKIPVHHQVFACTAISGGLAVAMDAGLIIIDLEDGAASEYRAVGS